MRKISSTQDFKASKTETLDCTKLLLERKARKEMVTKHGVLWFILYELFALDGYSENIITMEEFKHNVYLMLIITPVFLIISYSFLILITFLGGIQ